MTNFEKNKKIKDQEKYEKNRETVDRIGLKIPEKVEFDLNRICVFKIENWTNKMYGFRIGSDENYDLFDVKERYFAIRIGETREILVKYSLEADLPMDSPYFLEIFISAFSDEEAENYTPKTWLAKRKYQGPVRSYVTFAREEEKKEEKREEREMKPRNVEKTDEKSKVAETKAKKKVEKSGEKTKKKKKKSEEKKYKRSYRLY